MARSPLHCARFGRLARHTGLSFSLQTDEVNCAGKDIPMCSSCRHRCGNRLISAMSRGDVYRSRDESAGVLQLILALVVALDRSTESTG